MVCVIQVCWLFASRIIYSCSKTLSKTVWYISFLCVQWETPDDGQRNCSKHVEFHSKNNFKKLVHLFSCYYNKFIMIHGHTNVKLLYVFIPLIPNFTRLVQMIHFLSSSTRSASFTRPPYSSVYTSTNPFELLEWNSLKQIVSNP
jgi:hypothetical protein